MLTSAYGQGGNSSGAVDGGGGSILRNGHVTLLNL